MNTREYNGMLYRISINFRCMKTAIAQMASLKQVSVQQTNYLDRWHAKIDKQKIQEKMSKHNVQDS